MNGVNLRNLTVSLFAVAALGFSGPAMAQNSNGVGVAIGDVCAGLMEAYVRNPILLEELTDSAFGQIEDLLSRGPLVDVDKAAGLQTVSTVFLALAATESAVGNLSAIADGCQLALLDGVVETP